MTRLSFCFFVVCLNMVIGTSFAQTHIPAISQATSTAIIPERITGIEQSLSKIKQILENINIDNSTQLLQEIPVNEQNIDEKISALRSANAAPIKQKQVQDSEALRERIDSSIGKLQKQQNTLAETDSAIEQTKEAIVALQQLLSNPINQNNLTEEQLASVPSLQKSIQSVTEKAQQLTQDTNRQLQALQTSKVLLTRWQSVLAGALAAQQSTQTTDTETKRLSAKQQHYQNEVEKLENQIRNNSADLDLSDIEALQQNLYQQQTFAWLTGIDIRLATLIKSQSSNSSAIHSIQQNAPIPALEKQRQQTNQALQTLAELKNDVETQLLTFQNHTAITGAQPELDDAFTNSLKSIAYQRLHLEKKPQQLNRLIAAKKQQALLTRDTLFSQKTLALNTTQLWDALLQVAYQIKISVITLFQQISEKPYYIIALALTGIFLIYLLGRSMAQWVSYSSRQRGDGTGLFSSIRKVFYAIRRHLYSIVFLLFIVALVRVSDVPYPSDDIIRTLVYVVGALLIWLTLAKIEVKLGTLPKKLANRNTIVSVFLALTALLYNLSVLSSVNATIVTVYEKLLMLTIIVFTLVVKQNTDVYLNKEKHNINHRAHNLYRKLLRSIPWLVIAACVTSLIGYSRLAWSVLGYLGMISLYLLIITIGLSSINQLRKYLKLYSLRTFSHGAFIAQDIVSPLASIAKLGWLWAATVVLFSVIGWNKNSYLIAKALSIVNYPLFSFSDTKITLLTIFLLALSIYLIFRLAKWLRTFSYHWLYANINDLGVRNSLSIFSQYVAALAGVLIALNILGIDLTSLAVFAGALGVGVGLGLQDIAKNFISGILLLIERPLRTGDWVTIDGSEGTVKSIGMRAITMETFDKQEVIIPNGNAISNSFTNFTHSNSMIRTVLYVGAGYSCDPKNVIAILTDILNRTDGILKEPESKVVMWEYADSAINYRIQYYIDLDKSDLWETKTDILKKIWYDFKANDIEIPFPQRDIHFRNILTNTSAPTLKETVKTDAERDNTNNDE